MSDPKQDHVVEPIVGEPGRYHVMSHSQKGRYMVDLASYHGHGSCTCKDFQVRVQPERERGQIPQKRYCKHIAAARQVFLEERLDIAALLDRTTDMLIRQELLAA